MGNTAIAYDLGKRIRELRLSRGWTQKELAQRIGIHKSVISYFELGERYPAYDTLLKIAETFHVSTDFLLKGKDPRQLNIDDLTDRQLKAIQTLIDVITTEENSNPAP